MDAEEQENLNEQLVDASKNGDLPLIQLLFQKGADIHAQDDVSLQWASQNGYLEIVGIRIWLCIKKRKPL